MTQCEVAIFLHSHKLWSETRSISILHPIVHCYNLVKPLFCLVTNDDRLWAVVLWGLIKLNNCAHDSTCQSILCIGKGTCVASSLQSTVGKRIGSTEFGSAVSCCPGCLQFSRSFSILLWFLFKTSFCLALN